MLRILLLRPREDKRGRNLALRYEERFMLARARGVPLRACWRFARSLNGVPLCGVIGQLVPALAALAFALRVHVQLQFNRTAMV